MLTLILADEREIELVNPAIIENCVSILTFSPKIDLILTKKYPDIPIEGYKKFTSTDQQEIVLVVQKHLELLNACDDRHVPLFYKSLVRHSLFMLFSISKRLELSLGNGPWTYFDADENFYQSEDYMSVFKAILPRILQDGTAHGDFNHKEPSVPLVYNAFFKLAWLWKGKKKFRGVSTTRKLRMGLKETLKEKNIPLLILDVTQGGMDDYLSLFNCRFKAADRIRLPYSKHSDNLTANLSHYITSFSKQIEDITLCQAMKIYEPIFARCIQTYISVYSGLSFILSKSNMMTAYSFEANTWMNAAMHDAVDEMGGGALIVNHNSMPRNNNEQAHFVLSELFFARNFCGNNGCIALWSPTSNIDPVKDQVQPYRPVFPDRVSLSEKKFKILHADNYQNWHEYFPYVTQTSHEFVEAIRVLSEVVSEIPDVELNFRIRDKREVDMRTISHCIIEADNVSINSTKRDFLEELREADLMICHFSTTAEQALQMGVPVLFWGSAERYTQFEAKTTKPVSYEDRSATYAAFDANHLREMLIAIRKVHDNAPLKDEEFKQYKFPLSAPTIFDLIK